jgi:phosphoribosylanthranilate isomerase
MGFLMHNYLCKVKICGMTNMEDCLAAIDLGVDFIGFVFYKKSARYVTPETVREISEAINGRAKTVGVIVEETEDEIDKLVDFCHLDFVQVYNANAARKLPQKRAKRTEGVASSGFAGGGGDASPGNGANRICVYRIKDAVPEVAPEGLVLFDSYSEGFGGSGMSFDVNLLKGHSSLERAFIAGGIDEENVYRVLALKPFGVDLVSAVEKEKGKKDPFKMEHFMKKVRNYQI